MAKQEKKSTTKPDKGVWADIIKASVKGNPKPKKHTVSNTVNISEVLQRIETEVNKVAADYRKYLICQVGAGGLSYSFNYSCPTEKSQEMEKVLLEIANDYGLAVKTGGMPD